ncbi:Crp/Fnr family transcriptional regulator [Pedobacter sp. PWIIR3]
MKNQHLTEMTSTAWKNDAIAYLRSLYPQFPIELETALMAPRALRAKYGYKSDMLLIPNMKADEAHYLRKGLAKLYTRSERDKKEKIFYIWKENEMIVLLNAFKEHLPNEKFYIGLMEDAELVSLSNCCMDGIYRSHIAAHELTQKIMSLKTERRQDQLDILMADKADRYGMFVEKFPGICYRLTNQEICAFLGITPSTLTRAKKA